MIGEGKKGSFWLLPTLISIIAVLIAVVVSPHRNLDWDGTVVPLAQKYYGSVGPAPLEGKAVVITGVTSGIGLSLAKAMTKLGATVIGLGRNPKKLEAVQKEIPTMQPFVADFKDLASVSRAADEVLEKYEAIDILINNAGMHDAMTNIQGTKVSAQGYDQVFTVNYLSHFLLSEKLSSALHKSSKPTILQIASSFHYEVDGSDLMSQNTSQLPIAAQPGGNHGSYIARSSRSYANSKFAQILHARGLKRHHPLWKAAPNARVVSICPGVVGTNIASAAGGLADQAMSAGFPVDGWGIASPLIGMFSEDDNGDFFTSASVFRMGDIAQYMQHPLFYQLGLRDSFVWFGLFVLIFPFQHMTARIASQSAAPETYNVELIDSFYSWSSHAIREFV